MSGTLITFVSLFQRNPKEFAFDFPGRLESEPKITGILTNDAPVKYLLKTMRPSRVILLCSKEASEDKYGRDDEEIATLLGGVQTAESHITNVIREYSECINIPDPEIISIPYGDTMEDALAELLLQVKDGDVGLDITGGRRDFNILMLLIMRALGCVGCKITHSAYSQLGQDGNSIREVNHFGNLFDLMNGMYEMQTFGRTDVLKAILADSPNSNAYKLTEEIGLLIDSLSLCQIDLKKLKKLLDKIHKLHNQCTINPGLQGEMNVLFRGLLTAFNKKLRFLDKDCSLPTVLTWCVNHKMLQQALTIYNELMPDWLLSEGFIETDEDGYKKAKKKANPNYKKNAYESLTREIFKEYATNVIEMIDLKTYTLLGSCKDAYLTPKNMNEKTLSKLVLDFKWVVTLRNTINHSGELDSNDKTIELLKRAKRPVSLTGNNAFAQIAKILNDVIIMHLITLESDKKKEASVCQTT